MAEKIARYLFWVAGAAGSVRNQSEISLTLMLFAGRDPNAALMTPMRCGGLSWSLYSRGRSLICFSNPSHSSLSKTPPEDAASAAAACSAASSAADLMGSLAEVGTTPPPDSLVVLALSTQLIAAARSRPNDFRTSFPLTRYRACQFPLPGSLSYTPSTCATGLAIAHILALDCEAILAWCDTFVIHQGVYSCSPLHRWRPGCIHSSALLY